MVGIKSIDMVRDWQFVRMGDRFSPFDGSFL